MSGMHDAKLDLYKFSSSMLVNHLHPDIVPTTALLSAFLGLQFAILSPALFQRRRVFIARFGSS